MFDIIDLLKDQGSNWYGVGLCLKLKPAALDRIENATQDTDRRLTKVIDNWLKLNYNQEKFGLPTLKKLVDAVRSPSGGNNAALADKIAEFQFSVGE